MYDKLNKKAFTLVELLLALSVLAIITALTFVSFSSVNRSWQVGREVIATNGHSDYIMEQLTQALRSAYFSSTTENYGMVFIDDGSDSGANDRIEWTKTGRALIGENAMFADVPHRTCVYLSKEDSSKRSPGGFTVKAWRQDLQLDDFDSENDVQEIYLSTRVQGLNFRMLDPDTSVAKGEELPWIDEWAKTNTLPAAIEITLWLQPAEKDGEPIESKRIVEIPVAILSQNPSAVGSASSRTPVRRNRTR